MSSTCRASHANSPLEVYERPATRFIAGFIESPVMNFLDVAVEEGGRLRIAEGATLEGGEALAGQAGRTVTLGIRPEHLRLVDLEANGSAANDSGANSAAASGSDVDPKIDLVETLGVDTPAHGRIDADGKALTARLSATANVSDGDRRPLRVDPARCMSLTPRPASGSPISEGDKRR